MKLASIEVITKLIPIEGADRIELAQVLGWQTIVKKGEFKEGDFCVWHNPDTVVDGSNPAYEFLRKQAFRLKTAKFKGKFSQGLALPLYPLLGDNQPLGGLHVEGADVSDVVKITKYEKPIPACLGGTVLGQFPVHLIRRTDEPLLRSNPEAIKEFLGLETVGTLKLDGSSGTFIMHEGEFMVCSRNLQLARTAGNSFWRIADKYNLQEKMKAYGNIIIQGEIVGPGIQDNRLGLKEVDFFVFNVAIPNPERLYTSNVDISNMGLKRVPVVFSGWVDAIVTASLDRPVNDMDIINALQKEVNELKYPTGKPAEGMVLRPVTEKISKVLESTRLSVKIINENYKE